MPETTLRGHEDALFSRARRSSGSQAHRIILRQMCLSRENASDQLPEIREMHASCAGNASDQLPEIREMHASRAHAYVCI